MNRRRSTRTGGSALHAAALTVAAVAALALPACDDTTAEFVRPTAHPQPAPGTPPLQVEPELPPFNDQPWNRLSGNGWSYLRRSSTKDADIVDDSAAPFSAPGVLRIVFTPDMPRDHEPSVHWIGLPNFREVYAVWWIKLSSNWTPSPAGGGKMTFLHAAPNGQGQVYAALFGSSAPHRLSINTEWAPYGQHVWDPNAITTGIGYGRWHRIEWHVKWASAPDKADGVLRWWVDGVLNGAYTGVRFPSEGIGFHQFEFATTVQNPPPHEQYMYVDHSYISGR